MRSIPGPRRIPFLGSTGTLLRFFRDPIKCMLNLHDAYGEIAAVSGGDSSLVCAFGPDCNQQVLSDPSTYHNAAEFPIRIPRGSAIHRLTTFLVGMNGVEHQRLRRALAPLFQKSYLHHHRDSMVMATEAALAHWRPGTEIDLSEAAAELALGVSFRCLFGLDVTAESRPLAEMALGFTTGVTSPAKLLVPWDVPGLPYSRFMRQCERHEARLRELIDVRRKNSDEKNDTLSVLLTLRDEDGKPLSDSLLVGLANEMFIAGHDTTARTVAWTLFLLERHPAIRTKVLEELHAELRGEPPTVDDIVRLPMLDAVIKESQRILPATPWLFFRRPNAPVQLGPYELPAGSGIILSPLLTHRKPETFPEPRRFKPSRWNNFTPGPYAYLPFGAGPRMCLGVSFATLSLRVILAMILQRFRLTSPDDAEVSYQARGVILGTKNGVRMRIDRQDGASPTPRPVRGNIPDLVELD
ncbi:MAG: cytochrome P450 [Enhygromyxa sp.]